MFLVEYLPEQQRVVIDIAGGHPQSDGLAAGGYVRRIANSYLFLTWEIDSGHTIMCEFRIRADFWKLKSMPEEMRRDLKWIARETQHDALARYDLWRLITDYEKLLNPS